jgi:hypothetical protein
MSYFVPIFEFTVVSATDLHRVIGQVNQPVLYVFNVVLATGRPQVSFRVEVTLKIAIDGRGQRIEPDVELSALVEHWTLAVLLNDVRAFLAIDHVVADDLLDLSQFATHGDPAATIRIFARFHDP